MKLTIEKTQNFRNNPFIRIQQNASATRAMKKLETYARVQPLSTIFNVIYLEFNTKCMLVAVLKKMHP